ncbi:type II toxin-antitoxin system RelE/ParE family toxin [Bradyrhizobium sp. SSUT18]|uniref:type II toxin-antitoxin system RelE/ParE family toxin n=1 Tax=Bradyrhizobium sp. SSUT18 TaxID=3040602 RepID=UPI0032638344
MGPRRIPQANSGEAIGGRVQVVLSLRARTDLLEIHSYLAGRSSAAADRLAARFSERFDELRKFPPYGAGSE